MGLALLAEKRHTGIPINSQRATQGGNDEGETGEGSAAAGGVQAGGALTVTGVTDHSKY